jgi:hypothetical protein
MRGCAALARVVHSEVARTGSIEKCPMPTAAEIRHALFSAVQEVLSEQPYAGVRDAKEWAVSGRIGIVLARNETVHNWEECESVLIPSYSGAR